MVFSGIIAVISISILTFYPKETLNYSILLGFVENIFQLLYMTSSFSFSFLTFELLRKITLIEEFEGTNMLTFKKLMLFFMFAQFLCYLFNLFFVSFYNPIIYAEKILLSTMILILNVNSVFFSLMQNFFILTLKYDLEYINKHLQVRLDLEYFLEYDEEFIDGKYVKI